MANKYDIVIIGAGPSGVFLAYELIKKNAKKKVLLIEQGRRVEERSCPIEKINKCAHKAKGRGRNSDSGHMPYHLGGTTGNTCSASRHGLLGLKF